MNDKGNIDIKNNEEKEENIDFYIINQFQNNDGNIKEKIIQQ